MTVDRFRALQLWDHEDFRDRLRPPLRWFKVDSVQQSRIWVEPADWWTQGHPLTGVVCSDGSLLDPGPCARAAWGIKQVGLQSFELAGTLAGPQTVPRAGLTAVRVAAELATPPVVVVVDHFNLAAHWADAQGRLDDCLTSPLVDLLERLQAAIAGWSQGSFAIRWIPSHMDEVDTCVREARWRKASAGSIPAAWIAGNQRADELAGLAALEHRLPWSLRNRQREGQTAVADALTAGKIVALAANADRRDRSHAVLTRTRGSAEAKPGNSFASRPNRANAALRTGPQAGGHDTVQLRDSSWVCQRCGSVWSKQGMYRRYRN